MLLPQKVKLYLSGSHLAFISRESSAIFGFQEGLERGIVEILGKLPQGEFSGIQDEH